ncbi:hypothetical protein DMA11_16830 [Marinilabiliaceae bacterium JC017]|nr:hypothetical protein DMA11_16830 [Marinilabiliaceae bacterium JC017]
MRYSFLSFCISITLLCLLNQCSPTLHQFHSPKAARLGPETQFHQELKSLPPPKEKIITAVYKFRDQTGQYKPTEMGSSWSTAVTQGATTILIRALEESEWFIPIERENISNLLNERKIIRSSRAQYEGDKASNLPPLLFAGIILEGGIISYESNIRTGGIGVRYFGTGGSGQYREDRISIYLRAVSTSNGKILKTVYSTKSILSQQIDFGVFRYVKFKRLLEAETGVTYNEPSEMAVTEAIEKAVHSMILEGLSDSLWEVEASDVEKEALLQTYQREKVENQQIDHLGRKFFQGRGLINVSLEGGATYLDSDYPNPNTGFHTTFNSSFRLSPSFSIDAGITYGQVASNVINNYQFISFDPQLKVYLLPHERMTPYLKLGYGILSNFGEEVSFMDNRFEHISSSAGIEYMIKSDLGFNIGVSNKYFVNDNLDDMISGKYHDMLWQVQIGVSYYFGKNWKMKSLIQRK